MAVNDQDLELLESYLDDELAGRELEALRRRLSSEPQLMVAVDELRGQREARQQFFAACEPDEASVQRLIQSVRREATRETVWVQRNRALKWVGGLAACLAFGFVTGREFPSNTPAPTSPGESVVVAPGQQDNSQIARTPVIFDGMNVNRLNPRTVNSNVGGSTFSLRGTYADVGARDPFPGSHIYIIDRNNMVQQQFDSHAQYMKYVQEKLAASTQPSDEPLKLQGSGQ